MKPRELVLPMNHLPRNSRSRAYPLSLLFLLVAACAVVAALGGKGFLFLLEATRVVTSAWPYVGSAAASGGAMDEGVHLMIAIGTVLVATLLGAIVGLHHYRKLRGLVWGTVTGLVLGLLAAPLAVVPQSSLSHLVAATLGGSCILLFVALATRFTTRSDPVVLDGDGSE